MSIIFQLITSSNNNYLYQASDNQEGTDSYLYCIFNSTKLTLGDQLSLSQSLQYVNGTSGIVYFFYPQAEISGVDPGKLFSSLNVATTGISLVWLNQINRAGEASDFQAIEIPNFKYNSGTSTGSGTPSSIEVKIADAYITVISTGVSYITIEIDPSTALATITDRTQQMLKLSNGINDPLAPYVLINQAQINFAATKTSTSLPDTSTLQRGAFHFAGNGWDLQTLYTIIKSNEDGTWGGVIKYFYTANSNPTAISYPVFGRVIAPTPVDFQNQLDPLYPTKASRSYLMVKDPSQAPDVFAASMMQVYTPKGNAIQLNPIDQVGYYFCKDADSNYYLAPLGQFSLKLPDNNNQSQFMCGLSGLEFGQVRNGDAIQFMPEQAAYSPTFMNQSGGNQSDPLLTDEFLTSWIQVIPSTKWAYFSQPNTLANFSNKIGTNTCEFPVAGSTNIQIGQFPTTSGGNPTFPLAFYGSVIVFQGNATTDVITAFENEVLASSRFNLFVPQVESGNGPVFTSADGTPLSGGTVITSSGFLVQVNESNHPGTWNSLILAKSEGDFLQFKPSSDDILNPPLSVALMNSQGFLVINAWDKFQLDQLLTVSGFTFNVQDISDEVIPVMIFKYATTQSLNNLINTPGTWTNPNYFLKDGSISAAQQTLDDAISQAEKTIGHPNDPFKNFRDTILNDPTWTGFIVFNCPVDGSNMPPDFQILFAGVEGPLTAHHFGVDLNQIGSQSAEPQINKSSIFGVIYYTDPGSSGPPYPTYEFITKELIVVFQNSTIIDLQAQVGMMINELFQRSVYLQGEIANGDNGVIEPNTFYIQGQYQKQGEDGTVTFTSTKSHTYAFNPGSNYTRVLDKFVINGASLVSTGDVSQGTNTIVNSRFAVNGALFFSNPIVPGTEQPDLFSYGTENQGLTTTGLAFNISVTLDENGQAIQSSRTVTLDTSNLTVQSNAAAIRPNSLLKSLPFKLSELAQADEGSSLNLNKLGQVVNVLQLSSYPTDAPIYALKYDLSLGTLGGLSDGHASIDSTMVIAWGPSSTTPDNDGVIMYIQLPEASAGFKGFNLEGIVKTVFGDANLMEVMITDEDGSQRPVYVILFNNVAISILNWKFPPGIIADFILFADPNNGSGSNIAWNIAAAQK